MPDEQNTLTDLQARQVATVLHEHFDVTPYQKRFAREALKGFESWRFPVNYGSDDLALVLSWREGKLWLEADGPTFPQFVDELERARKRLHVIKRTGQGKGQRIVKLRFSPKARPRLSGLAERQVALPA
jgi:hypothetical protein